ncbi:T9SS type A sorting domain-containing protein [candidate division KSB1 bacterium]|nr:T9SS type A sorting domain-containing protein [candidate division KSB1 bacterium]
MTKPFMLPLFSVIVLLCGMTVQAQTFSFVQHDTLIYYQNVDTVYEFHASVHNLLPQTHTLLYTLTPVLFADTARNTSICTYVGCYPPHSGSYSVPQEYESAFDDDLVKFTVYNIISDWSQGFPMPVESSLVGDYVFDITVANAAEPSEFTTARVSLIYGDGVVPQVVAPLPGNAALVSNFPNPFNASTEIRFSLAEHAPVQLAVYDLLGREVAKLVDGAQFHAGSYRLNWNATSASGPPLPSGNYLVRLLTPGQSATHRIALIR